MISPSWSQTSSSFTSPTEQIVKETYKSFLRNVMDIDLTKYNLTNQGYGVSYPPSYGDAVREEVVSFTLDSTQGNATTWGTFDNGILTSCHINPPNLLFFENSPSENIFDAAKSFLQKYQTFAMQYSSKDISYLTQALSTLDTVKGQTVDTIVGNMKLAFSSDQRNNSFTHINWIYTQNNVNMTLRAIGIGFFNSRVISFGDSWNLYTQSNAKTVSEESAKSVAYAAAKNYDLNLTQFQGINITSAAIKLDLSNMAYDASLLMVPGNSLNPNLSAIHLAFPSNTTRDSLMLYPFWHFIFYFSEPVGHTIGLEVGVWGDTKELSYCHEYGYLGDLGSTPQSSSGQSSNQTGQLNSLQLQPFTLIALLITASAIIIACYVVIWKRNKH